MTQNYGWSPSTYLIIPEFHKATRDNKWNNTYDIRPPKNAKLPPISLIFRWHESNKPDVVVAGAVGPIICAGDRNILTRPLRLSIFGNVLIRVYNLVYVIVSLPFLFFEFL